MSGLYLNTGLCQGWNNPNNNFTTPTISYLSGTFSPVGGNTLVAIFGTNFKLYSLARILTLALNNANCELLTLTTLTV